MSQSPIDMLSIRESWRMFRILAEIVDGFETLSDLGPCVSIFGSGPVKPENPLYAEGETIAKLLVESGYGVITGGGPGLMEAGNKGATEAGGTSVGLHIQLPHEQECNKYVKIRSDYRYFFLRKLMFVKYALAYVVMPAAWAPLTNSPKRLCSRKPNVSVRFPLSCTRVPSGTDSSTGSAAQWFPGATSGLPRWTISSRSATRPNRSFSRFAGRVIL